MDDRREADRSFGRLIGVLIGIVVLVISLGLYLHLAYPIPKMEPDHCYLITYNSGPPQTRYRWAEIPCP